MRNESDRFMKVLQAWIKHEQGVSKSNQDRIQAQRESELKTYASSLITFSISTQPTRVTIGNSYILDLAIENKLPIEIQTDEKSISLKTPFIQEDQSTSRVTSGCTLDESGIITIPPGSTKTLRWICQPHSFLSTSFLMDRYDSDKKIIVSGKVNLYASHEEANIKRTENKKDFLYYDFSIPKMVRFETPILYVMIGAMIGGIISYLAVILFHVTASNQKDSTCGPTYAPLNIRILKAIKFENINYGFAKVVLRIFLSVVSVTLFDLADSTIFFIKIKIHGLPGALVAGALVYFFFRKSNFDKIQAAFQPN